MIYIQLMGGLGNQLFQIFAGIAYSLKNNIPFKIINYKVDKVSPFDNTSLRPTYFNNFLLNLSNYTCNYIHLPAYNEPNYTYNNIPYSAHDFKILGYFQSSKYFESYKQDIVKLINLEEQKISIKKKYMSYFNHKMISLHFRIGDYIKNPDRHPILEPTYYINALTHILTVNDKYDILYFSEERDEDQVHNMIEMIKLEFPQLNFIQCSYDIADWEQVLLMSCCNHNIIANSTFSWWGAYFNSNSEKIVCYPNRWFGPAIPNSTDDLFPDNWIKI